RRKAAPVTGHDSAIRPSSTSSAQARAAATEPAGSATTSRSAGVSSPGQPDPSVTAPPHVHGSSGSETTSLPPPAPAADKKARQSRVRRDSNAPHRGRKRYVSTTGQLREREGTTAAQPDRRAGVVGHRPRRGLDGRALPPLRRRRLAFGRLGRSAGR